MCERKLVHVQSCSCRGTKTHLSVLKLHIKEVKVPEDSELLLRGGVVHVVRLPGPFIGGHQAGLVLHEVQLPTAGEDHLYRETKRENMIKGHFPMQWRSKSFISLRLRGASYRRVFCEPHFLSTQRQNIHQLFTCSFLQRARGNGNIVSKTRMSQFNFTETTQHFYPKSN